MWETVFSKKQSSNRKGLIMPRARIIKDNTFEGITINCSEVNPCYEGMVRGVRDRLNDVLEHCGKVTVAHLTMSLPENQRFTPEEANSVITTALNSYLKTNRQNDIYTHAVWCREQGKNSLNPHGHIGLMLDGNKTQNAMNHALRLNFLVTKQLGIPPESTYVRYNPPQFGDTETVLKIRKNDAEVEHEMENACHWLSYLAKISTKDASSVRHFGMTQLQNGRE